MTPKEILMNLIIRIGFTKSILSSNKGKFYSKVPGEIIASLSDEKRGGLQKLTSEDVSKINPEAPIEFFCDTYYADKDVKDKERELKEAFDKKVFNK